MPKTTTDYSSWTGPEYNVRTEAWNRYNDLRASVRDWSPSWQRNIAGLTPEQQNLIAQTQNAINTGKYNWGSDAAKQAAQKVFDYEPTQITFDQAGLDYNLVDKYAPMVQGVFDKYKISDLESILSNYQVENLDPSQFLAMSQSLSSGFDVPAVAAGQAGAMTASAERAIAAQAQAAQATADKINRSDIRDLSADLGKDQLASYLAAVDPTFYNDVMQVAQNELRRAKEMEDVRLGAQAAAAGAFGGGRHGLVEAENTRSYLDMVQKQAAELNLQKLGFAKSLMDADLARKVQVGALNQAADLQTALENARLGTQTNLTNVEQLNRIAALNAELATQTSATNAQLGTQANIENARLGTQASIANADYATRAALARQQLLAQSRLGLLQTGLEGAIQAGLQNQRVQAELGKARGEAGLSYNDMLTRRAAAESAPLTQFATTQFLTDADFEKFNKETGVRVGQLNEQNRQSALGLGIQAGGLLSNAAANQAQIDTGLANSLFGMSETQRQINQQIWDAEAFRDTMVGMTPILKQTMLLDSLGSMPYAMESGGHSVVNQQTPWTTWLGLGMQGAGLLAMMSDKRLKKNVSPMNPEGGAVEKVKRMKGVKYQWKGSGRPDAGLLAQDVEKADPSAVVDVGGMKAVKIPQVLGLLTDAIKELDRKVSSKGRRA